MTEADNCRELVTPRLVAAGWGTSESVIGEQHSFTNGRIVVAGGKVRRGKQRRADDLLHYRRDIPLEVVEAKEVGLPAETGVQQAHGTEVDVPHLHVYREGYGDKWAVDTGHPALLRMWEKRQRGYRAMGYRVGVDASDGPSTRGNTAEPSFACFEQHSCRAECGSARG